VEVKSLSNVIEMLDKFRSEIESKDRKFDLWQAMDIMGIDPQWFVDERSIDMIELYLFHRQNPSLAFPVSMSEQPSIWIYSKIALDEILKESIL
jgi:hypothetical protein